ncbi:alpha/beta hydrolase [Agreia sp. Leaf283]|uniref:alpha/beta hydrolase n=1 Tax=Agreia sp. Leaf283 TaxID=1736321 RepID=UPI0006F25E68|nr:alpha/beta hydrolase [Agreia sp. Leaf283]KQP54725.1 esterase [Agreia sp. Leaf283]
MNQSSVPIPVGVSDQARAALSVPAFQLDYPAIDDAESWKALIEATNKVIQEQYLASAGSLPVTISHKEVAGVPIFEARAEGLADSADVPICIDFHGGALIYCGGSIAAEMISGTALINGMITWGPDYRMPPEHPYPAALDDAIAVYRAALDVRDPADIFVQGSSAGGNLAAALLVRAYEEGLPMPAGLVLISPEIDLTESGDTFQTLKGVDKMASLMPVNELYAAGRDLADPLLSPLFADVTHFPPTLLTAGGRDLFLSNAARMHRKLRAAGIEAELHVFEAMTHGGFGGASPEDLSLNDEVRRFYDRHRRL